MIHFFFDDTLKKKILAPAPGEATSHVQQGPWCSEGKGAGKLWEMKRMKVEEGKIHEGKGCGEEQ